MKIYECVRTNSVSKESDEPTLAFGGVSMKKLAALNILGMRMQNDVRWTEHGFDQESKFFKVG